MLDYVPLNKSLGCQCLTISAFEARGELHHVETKIENDRDAGCGAGLPVV